MNADPGLLSVGIQGYLCYDTPMSRRSMPVVPFDEAYHQIQRRAGTLSLPAESLPLAQAHGRILAEDLRVPLDLPQADNSAMDGYCCRQADIAGASAAHPVELPIAGHIDAGHPLPQLPPGTAAYIATGGLVPSGADTIVIIEETTVSADGRLVRISSCSKQGAFIRLRGKDAQAGEMLLTAGQELTPFRIGLLAAHGFTAVNTYRRPRVAIITSGDEVVMPFEVSQPWQVRNANSVILPAQVLESGAVPIDLGIVPDTPGQAQEFLRRALTLADVIVTSGGISMGRKDPFVAAFADLHCECILHGVRMKPGKPVYFGFLKDKPLFGLPGNQVSTAVTFEVFVRPFLRRLLRASPPDRRLLHLPLAAAAVNPTGRDHFVRGSLCGEAGTTEIRLFDKQDSHLLSGLADADVLFRHPWDTPEIPAGQVVSCSLLDWSSAPLQGPS